MPSRWEQRCVLVTQGTKAVGRDHPSHQHLGTFQEVLSNLLCFFLQTLVQARAWNACTRARANGSAPARAHTQGQIPLIRLMGAVGSRRDPPPPALAPSPLRVHPNPSLPLGAAPGSSPTASSAISRGLAQCLVVPTSCHQLCPCAGATSCHSVPKAWEALGSTGRHWASLQDGLLAGGWLRAPFYGVKPCLDGAVPVPPHHSPCTPHPKPTAPGRTQRPHTLCWTGTRTGTGSGRCPQAAPSPPARLAEPLEGFRAAALGFAKGSRAAGGDAAGRAGAQAFGNLAKFQLHAGEEEFLQRSPNGLPCIVVQNALRASLGSAATLSPCPKKQEQRGARCLHKARLQPPHVCAQSGMQMLVQCAHVRVLGYRVCMHTCMRVLVPGACMHLCSAQMYECALGGVQMLVQCACVSACRCTGTVSTCVRVCMCEGVRAQAGGVCARPHRCVHTHDLVHTSAHGSVGVQVLVHACGTRGSAGAFVHGCAAAHICVCR